MNAAPSSFTREPRRWEARSEAAHDVVSNSGESGLNNGTDELGAVVASIR